MVSPNVPIVNAGVNYCNSLQLTWIQSLPLTSLPSISVSPGAARDRLNVDDIILQSLVQITTNIIGPNGVDINALDQTQSPPKLFANQFYAVYVIGDSTSYKPTAAILSISTFAPELPSGYDMSRRIGWVKTDSSRNILSFNQYGQGQIRRYYYGLLQLGIAPTPGSTPTTFTAQTFNGTVPPINTEVVCSIQFNPTTANSFVQFLPFGSPFTGGGEGNVLFGCGESGQNAYDQIVVPSQLNGLGQPSVFLKSSNAGDSISVQVLGFIDYL